MWLKFLTIHPGHWDWDGFYSLPEPTQYGAVRRKEGALCHGSYAQQTVVPRRQEARLMARNIHRGLAVYRVNGSKQTIPGELSQDSRKMLPAPMGSGRAREVCTLLCGPPDAASWALPFQALPGGSACLRGASGCLGDPSPPRPLRILIGAAEGRTPPKAFLRRFQNHSTSPPLLQEGKAFHSANMFT